MMLSPSPINTFDPIALRYLMSETIFDIEVTRQEAPAVGDRPHFPYFGKNKRNYLFLTQEKQYEWMPEAAMEAFIKTLAALKLVADDVAVLNVAKLTEVPATDDLFAFFEPKVIISLGASFVWPEQTDVTVLQTYSFDEMLADAEKKRDFWTKIKTLLG